MKKAIVLLSGGVDSATTLYLARKQGYKCFCLIFDYGQRHKREILCARRIARITESPYKVLKISLPWKGSSLLDKKLKVPVKRNIKSYRIPSTYVPARNIIFLSFALSCAEAIRASAIFIGANSVDFSNYPDCRPEFYRAFRRAAEKGTKKCRGISIEAPLLHKSKEDIVRLGLKLGVPYELTWSCYKGGIRPCGICDACRLRKKGGLK